MRVDCTYTFHCSVEGCDVTDVQHYSDVREHRQAPPPIPPRGWIEVGLLGFCPRHTLMMEIDGEQVALLRDPATPPPTS